MNINAIKRNCKGSKIAIILNSVSGSQWITNGQSAWLVEGMTLNVAALEALFDLSAKALTKWLIQEKPVQDPRFSTLGTNEEEAAEEAGAVVYQDAVYVGVTSDHGMLYIPYDAIRHIKVDYRRYAVRWLDGKPMVAVYGDMFCQALLMPLNNESAERMRDIARKLAAPTYQWPDEEQEAANAEAEAEELIARICGDSQDEGETDDEDGEEP